MKGYIIFQKKYLYINDDGNVEDWSYTPEGLTNDYNHVSIILEILDQKIFHLMNFLIK